MMANTTQERKTIERYDIHHNPNQKRPEMWSALDGDWVLFDDHVAREQALQAEVDRLRADLLLGGLTIAKRLDDAEQARLDGLREGFQGGLAEDGPPMLNQPDFDAWFELRFAAFLASRPGS